MRGPPSRACSGRGGRCWSAVAGSAAGRRAERPEPRDAAGWARDNGVTLGAVTLIVIQLLWMGTLLARSYFRQDDYFNFDRALASGFTWKYLMLLSAGHMAPLGFAISWVLARARAVQLAAHLHRHPGPGRGRVLSRCCASCGPCSATGQRS